MKVLFTGKGTSGSWKIRGAQLAAALNAEAIPNAVNTDADVVVLVKRVEDRTLRAMHGRKLVWDVVDSFPQQAGDNGNEWTEREAKDWLKREFERIAPHAVIAATQAMAEDLKGFGVPVLCLRHHHRPKIARNPIRERITVIGYEGSPTYLHGWRRAIERQCVRIGARFQFNPDRLADCDVVLALRDQRGYPARRWKSNVKLANAHASGTPFVGCREAGYLETATGCEYWADTERELAIALDWLADQSTREQVSDRFVQAAYPVERAAQDLRTFLGQHFA